MYILLFKTTFSFGRCNVILIEKTFSLSLISNTNIYEMDINQLYLKNAFKSYETNGKYYPIRTKNKWKMWWLYLLGGLLYTRELLICFFNQNFMISATLFQKSNDHSSSICKEIKFESKLDYFAPKLYSTVECSARGAIWLRKGTHGNTYIGRSFQPWKLRPKWLPAAWSIVDTLLSSFNSISKQLNTLLRPLIIFPTFVVFRLALALEWINKSPNPSTA